MPQFAIINEYGEAYLSTSTPEYDKWSDDPYLMDLVAKFNTRWEAQLVADSLPIGLSDDAYGYRIWEILDDEQE